MSTGHVCVCVRACVVGVYSCMCVCACEVNVEVILVEGFMFGKSFKFCVAFVCCTS